LHQNSKKIRKMHRTKKAVSTQSVTTAVHIALYELGAASGDEIIVSMLILVATVNSMICVSATLVFVDDVDLRT